MTEQTFSWVRAYEEGSLTATQMETLQDLVDDDEAESLLEAARLLDFQATTRPGEEPGAQAY